MPAPDQIIVNATVLTIDEHDRVTEALAIADGRILAVGSRDEIEALADESTLVTDAGGATIAPGFIDPHSHVTTAAPFVRYAALQVPPVGTVTTVDDVMGALRATRDRLNLAEGDWLIGWGWFPDDMTDGGDLTAELLDTEFADLRVAVVHVSMHGGVVNGRVLAEHGYLDGVPDPAGGTIVRIPGTRTPAGALWESAWIPLADALPQFTEVDLDAMLAEYARSGITTAQDGAASWEQIRTVRAIAAEKPLLIDVASLVLFTDLEQALADPDPSLGFGSWEGGHRVHGLKLILDGSPQGRTAHVTEEYLTGGPQGEQHWHGIAVIDQPTTDALVEAAYRRGIQVFAHCNADAAIDQLIAAHRAAVAAGAPARGRTIPIHSQVMRLDQLDDYVELGFEPSMFTVHTYFFGDVHVTNFGMERASGISPMASAYAKGLRPTNHSDYPVTPLAMTWMIWSSVARTTLTGTVLGAGERVTRSQALRAVTINAAYEYGLEGDRGSLEAGKLADLVFLDGNPLTVETDALRELKVLRTVKRGVVVFEAE